MLLENIFAVLKVLVPFGALSFVQNMAFTASSRSRNSGDPNYHRKCALVSNGVYYITNALLTLYIIKYGEVWQLVLQGVVYTLATAEGSVLMMRNMLAKESGKRAVGAGQKSAAISEDEWKALQETLKTLPGIEQKANDAYMLATNLAPDSGLSAIKVGDQIVTNLPTR